MFSDVCLVLCFSCCCFFVNAVCLVPCFQVCVCSVVFVVFFLYVVCFSVVFFSVVFLMVCF